MGNTNASGILAVLLTAAAVTAIAFPCEVSPIKDMPYCNRSLSADARAALLVSQMSLVDLVAQMITNAPAIPRLGMTMQHARLLPLDLLLCESFQVSRHTTIGVKASTACLPTTLRASPSLLV